MFWCPKDEQASEDVLRYSAEHELKTHVIRRERREKLALCIYIVGPIAIGQASSRRGTVVFHSSFS